MNTVEIIAVVIISIIVLAALILGAISQYDYYKFTRLQQHKTKTRTIWKKKHKKH
jgi:Tfp pilus assembly protein PilV